MAVKKVWLVASFPAFGSHFVKEFDHAFWVTPKLLQNLQRHLIGLSFKFA